MSRPVKPVGTHLAITAIRMPHQVKTKLEILSSQTGLAQQEHIRRALDAYFDQLEAAGKFDPKSKPNVNYVRRGRPPVPEPEPVRVLRRPGLRAVPEPEPRRRVFRRPSMGAAA